MENALVHQAGDVEALTAHISLLDKDRNLLAKLRRSSLEDIHTITWQAAGKRLHEVYAETIADFSRGRATDVLRRVSP
jgi:glycosyltransferase involved in cell wall biosynthesis